MALAMAFMTSLRRWFGPALVVPLLPFAVPGTLLILVGAWLGERIFRVLVRPTVKSVFRLLVLAGLVTPFATGIVDLILRRLTP